MTAESTWEDLRSFLEVDQETNVLVGAVLPGSTSPGIIERLNLTADVADQFQEMVRSRFARVYSTSSLRPYIAGYKLENDEVASINLSEEENLRTLIDLVLNVSGADVFEEDEQIIEHFRFYVTVLGARPGPQAAFFHTYFPSKELTHRRRGLVLMQDENTYNVLEKKVFLFGDDFACVSHGDWLYVRSLSQFERIFTYYERIRAAAADTLNLVLEKVPVRNEEEFRDAMMSQVRMLSKLAQVSQKRYLNDITMEDVKRTIRDFDLPIDLETVDGQEMLVFDGALSRRWLIIKLLDDDYLGSSMTNLKYETNSKIPL